MKDFLPLLKEFVHRLQNNPAIRLDAQNFRSKPNVYRPKEVRPLEIIKRDFECQYGFDVSAADEQLLLLPYNFDIAWVVPEHLSPAERLGGEICLINPADSLNSSRPTVPADIKNEWAHNAYWFDAGGTYDLYDPCTVLLYKAEQRTYAGLAIFADKGAELLWLDLSWSEYLYAALTWHGAYAWPFLYLEFSYFQSLSPRWKALVAPLRRLLPKLFPDADWSVIAAKQAYFDAAEAAEQEIARHY